MADHEMNTVSTDPLRNAPLLSEEDSASETSSQSSEVSTTEQETQTHIGPHLETPRHIIAWQLTKEYGFQAYLWLQVLYVFLSYLGAKGIVVSKSVMRGLQQKMYVFFQGSSYPYRLQDTILGGAGVAPVEWYYDADKKIFISSNLYNTSTDYTTHHLEWLSAEIKYNNMTLYDITEHVQQVRWAGTTRPTPSHILAAWTLETGVVLNTMDGVTLHTFNEDGTESQLSLKL